MHSLLVASSGCCDKTVKFRVYTSSQMVKKTDNNDEIWLLICCLSTRTYTRVSWTSRSSVFGAAAKTVNFRTSDRETEVNVADDLSESPRLHFFYYYACVNGMTQNGASKSRLYTVHSRPTFPSAHLWRTYNIILHIQLYHNIILIIYHNILVFLFQTVDKILALQRCHEVKRCRISKFISIAGCLQAHYRYGREESSPSSPSAPSWASSST